MTGTREPTYAATPRTQREGERYLDQNSPLTVALWLSGLGFIAGILRSLVGLGVSNLVQYRRRKRFAVLGTILNGFVILSGIALWLTVGA